METRVVGAGPGGGVPTGGWLESPQPQDLLLTLLADNVRHRLESVRFSGLNQLLCGLGFSPADARAALNRLTRRRLIVQVRDDRVVSCSLTPLAEQLLSEGDQRIFRFGLEECTANTVTVLLHTIPEQQRTERVWLSRRLRFLGFREVQDGIWLAVGLQDVESLPVLEDLGLREHCSLLTGQLSSESALHRVLNKASRLEDLDRRYETFVGMFETVDLNQGLADAEAFRLRTQLVHTFRHFPYHDLGISWMGSTAWRGTAIRLFHTLYRDLCEPAQRYFDSVVGPLARSRHEISKTGPVRPEAIELPEHAIHEEELP